MLKAWIVNQSIGKFSEVWIWRQVRGFEQIQPHIVCWNQQDDEDSQALLNGHDRSLLPFDVEPHKGRGRWWHRLRNLRTLNFYATVGRERRHLIQQARADKPDVILAHFGYLALRMLPIAERLKIPIVAHFHGLDLSSGFNNRWYRWSLSRALPKFDAAVVVGTHQKQKLLELGMPAERIHLIPCGVPTEQFEADPGSQGTGMRFICVSRLAEFKGLDYTISAFAQVASTRPGSELLIIGEGDQRTHLEALAQELGVADKVRFLGSASNQVVKSWLQRSDVFCQHSVTGRTGWIEGFGVSITEAMACELPVVVTDCGGITNQVVHRQTGLVVGQRDRDAMARAMAELADDPQLRKRLGKAGRERAVAEFDTARQVHRLEQILLDVGKKG